MFDNLEALAERPVCIFPAQSAAGTFLPFAQVFKQLSDGGLDAEQAADAIEAAHELGWVFFSAWKATVTLLPDGVDRLTKQSAESPIEAYLIAAE